MRTVKIFGWEVKRIHVERAVKIKFLVCVGIIAAMWLPSHLAVVVSTMSNMIWLWRL